MIDVIIVIVIRMQNHKCNEMENAFQIFKVSCLVRVTQIHITMVITKWFLLFPTCDKWLDPYTLVLNWWSVFVINFIYDPKDIWKRKFHARAMAKHTMVCALTFMPPTLRTERELARFMLSQQSHTHKHTNITVIIRLDSTRYSVTWNK